MAAVPAIGAAELRKLFASEGGNPVAAVAGLHEDFYAVSEYNGFHGGYLK